MESSKKAAMDSVAAEIKDSDFVCAYLSEYQDGDLNGPLKERFEDLLKQGDKSLLENYVKYKGHLQVAFSEWSLSLVELQNLRSFVEDDVARADHEANNIKHVAQTEIIGNTLRAVILISLVFVAFTIGYYYVGPTPQPKFNSLETLVYEADVLMEDDERLDLPTSNLDEVKEYIARYPKLGFKPYIINSLKNWKVEGSTVIDYEFAKIPLVQFAHEVLGDKLFIFQYKGLLSDLRHSESGSLEDFTYQAYSNEKVNIIAWQVSEEEDEEVMGLMIGSRGALEMAKLAVESMTP